MSLARSASLVLLTLAAGAVAADSALEREIRAQVARLGERAYQGGADTPVGGLDAAGRCHDGTAAQVVRLEVPPPGSADMHTDTAFWCASLGTLWLHRTGGFVATDTWTGPHLLPGRAGSGRIARAIRADLAARRFPAELHGEPGTGPHGETLPRLAEGGVLVALAVPPADSADMFTDVAYVTPDDALWWAHRSGGFAGVSQWTGPWRLRLARDAAPTRVVPERVAVRSRAVRRTLTIRRAFGADDAAPGVRPERPRAGDYAPEDVALGDGVRVLRVLRATRRLLRVRVEIAADAETGPRDARVRDAVGDGLLTLVRRAR